MKKVWKKKRDAKRVRELMKDDRIRDYFLENADAHGLTLDDYVDAMVAVTATMRNARHTGADPAAGAVAFVRNREDVTWLLTRDFPMAACLSHPLYTQLSAGSEVGVVITDECLASRRYHFILPTATVCETGVGEYFCGLAEMLQWSDREGRCSSLFEAVLRAPCANPDTRYRLPEPGEEPTHFFVGDRILDVSNGGFRALRYFNVSRATLLGQRVAS